MILITIIAFLVVFSVLILVHELGHFVMARKAGIKVEEFGLGLPPKAKKLFKDKKGTEYTLNWIPFGGFVRMYGEDSSDPKVIKDKKSFASKSLLRRTSVIVAGVLMNFLLAWVIISIGFTVGMKPFLVTESDLEKGIESGIVEVENVLYIHEIAEGSVLAGTDLEPGDVVVSVNDKSVPSATDLSTLIAPGESIRLVVIRNGEEGVLDVKADSEGKLGFVISDEQMVLDVKNVKYPFYSAPYFAIKEVGRLSVLTVGMLGDVIVSLVAKFTTNHFISQLNQSILSKQVAKYNQIIILIIITLTF